jgi:hypothetical protein
MIGFIVIGVIVILVVNGIYTLFCENVRRIE